MALYLENRQSGIALFHALSRTPEIDPHFVHFVSSDWFRERHLNCFVLQVEPTRHMNKDQVIVGLMEAQYIQRIRDLFFTRITELIENQRGEWHKGLYNN